MSLKIEKSKLNLAELLTQNHTKLLRDNDLAFYTTDKIMNQLIEQYSYFLHIRTMHCEYDKKKDKLVCWYSGRNEIFAIKEQNPKPESELTEITYTPNYRGSHLIFYSKEANLFRETAKIKLSQQRTITIIRKIARHNGLKIEKKQITFTAHKNGHAYPNGWNRLISLPRKPDMYVTIHEIAHIIDSRKRETRHDKKFMQLLSKIHAYAKKNYYWITTELRIKPQETTELMKVNV
jgi:predicted metal-dependent hydrolase